jgi:hypothetical protein
MITRHGPWRQALLNMALARAPSWTSLDRSLGGHSKFLCRVDPHPSIGPKTQRRLRQGVRRL